jgi:TetR/AcrR family transcriptional repressor of nem operon
MRYDAEHKERTHRRIVRNAARQFRAKGLTGPAVPALMKSAGLTHGGFYKHFSKRDDLVVEAVEESLREIVEVLTDAAKKSETADGWKAMVTTYLSLERCDRAEIGCPFAAMAADIGRGPLAMKNRISAAILKFREALLPFMPGRTGEERAANFVMLITSMIGAISLARTMPDAAVRQRILSTVRERLLSSF